MMKIKRREIKLCECGCGQITNLYRGKYRKFIHGHNQRDKHHSIKTKKLMSKAQKNHPCSEEARKNMSIAQTGKVMSKEVIEKIKKTLTGRVVSKETREKLRIANTGKKASKETREKMSRDRQGRITSEETKIKLSKAFEGENHWNWQGGISKEPYTQDWTNRLKEKIRKRDNNKCQICGISQKKLNYNLCVHHINYDKKNCKEDNLISLCRSCHTKTNKDKKYWLKYFKKKIKMIVK